MIAQIRQEAGPLFYAENHFALDVQDYDSGALCKFTVVLRRVVAEFGVLLMECSYQLDPRPNWINLIEWCRASYDKRTIFSLGKEEVTHVSADPLDLGTVPLRLACAMFDIVEKLRDRSWEEVEGTLAAYRDILGSLDRRWMD